MADGEIIVEVSLDSDKTEKDFEQLLNKLSEQKLDLSRSRAEIRSLQKTYFEYADSLKNIPELGNNEKFVNDMSRVRNELKQAIKESESLRQKSAETSNSLQNIAIRENDVATSAKEASNLIKESTSGLASDYKTLENVVISAKNAYSILNSEVSRLGPQSGQAVENLYSKWRNMTPALMSAKNAYVHLNNELSNSYSKIAGISSRLSGFLANTASNLYQFIGKITGALGSVADSISSKINMLIKRTLGLLSVAFVFNVFRRGLSQLATDMGMIIQRDNVLSRSLAIVKANLINAFYPIWRVVLPWIRLLGEAIVWLSQRLVSFINFLTGSKSKIITTVGDANRVISGFNASIGKGIDVGNIGIGKANKGLGKATNKAKKLNKQMDKNKKSTNKATKEVNQLLASFDKLEVLDIDTSKALGLESLENVLNKPNLDNIANIDVEFPDLSEKIGDASTAIGDAVNSGISNGGIAGIENVKNELGNATFPGIGFEVDPKSQEAVDNLKQSLKELWDKLEPVRTLIKKVVKKLVDFTTELLSTKDGTDMLTIAIGALAGIIIVKKVAGLILGIKDALALLGIVFDFIAMHPVMATLGLLATIALLIIKNWDKVKPAIDKAWDAVKRFGQDIKDSFVSAIQKTYDKIKGIIDKIKNAFSAVKQALGFGGGEYKFEVSGAMPPRLAQGSVLRGGDPFLAYVNDQPRGQTNIEAPLDTIVDAFREAIRSEEFGQQNVVIEASGDMGAMVRMLNLRLKDEQTRIGSSMIEGL